MLACMFTMHDTTSDSHILRNFRFLCLKIFVCFLVQITFFAAIMCIDKRRQEKRKLDCLHCVTSTAPTNAGYCCGVFGTPSSTEGYRTRAMTWLGAQYSKKSVKAAVIALWLGVLAAGALWQSAIAPVV